MYLLGVIGATIIVFLIAVYFGIKKKEPEVSKDFLKKEKTFEAEKPKIKEPERIIEQNQPQNQILGRQQPESDDSESGSKPPFQPPSEPEVL
jgi:hypothetical protein